MFANDVGHLCGGRRIQKYVDTVTLGFWEILVRRTASPACPAQSGSLAMTSVTFAAVICDADEPCSVKTACAPESSFTMSPRSATRPWYFWYFGSNSEFWDDRCPSVWQSGLSFSLCACRMTSLLLLTLSNCRAGNFSSLACSVLQPLWASLCSHLATHSRLHGNFLTTHVVEDVSKKKMYIYIHLDILTLGILSNLGSSSIFTKVYVDMASAACPSQSGCLAFETQMSPVQFRIL